MNTPSTPSSAVDEAARRRFEAAWNAGSPEPIERFLPPQGDPRYLATLEELVAIELELRWKSAARAAGPAPRLEGYLERFPGLNRPDVARRLADEADRARRQYGDRPPTMEPTAFAAAPDAPAAQTATGGDSGGGADALATVAPEGDPLLAPPRGPGEVGWLGSYRVLRELGRGGMGRVYLAEDSQLRRPVALKVMLPALAAGPTAHQRFLREARAAASVKHDHVVTIHQVGEDRGIPFLAMEFLEGEPLDRWLERDSRPITAEVLRLGREMAEGLAAAHAKGLVHRDIKPANVWLEAPSGRVKILDFGLARLDDGEAGLTNSGTLVGTPAYMAPEQARGEAVDARSDLFSLGCVLYQLCTGRRPFQGATAMAVLSALALDHPVPVREVNPATPPALADLVMRLLEKEPARRPASAREVADALQAIRAAAPVPTEARSHDTTLPAAPRAPASGRRWRPRLLAALAVGLAVLLPLAYYFAPTVFRVATDQGDLVVSVDDPEVEVAVKQGGVVVRPRAKEREFLVKAGKGVLEVYRPGEAEAILVKDFDLSRGGRTVVTIRREEVAKNGPDPKTVGDPYRRLAEWVMQKRGRVLLQGVPDVKSLDQLPQQPFTVYMISLNSGYGQAPGDEEALLGLLAALPRSLTTVALEGPQSIPPGQTLQQLADSPGTRDVNVVSVNNAPLTDDDLRQLPRFPNLKSLFLRDTDVTDEGVKYARNHLALTAFSFGGTKGKVTARCLGDLDPRLRQLGLKGAWVTDAVVDGMMKLPNLDSVEFADAQVTDAGVARFIQRYPALKTLHLWGSKVTDGSLAALADHKGLTDLNLSRLPIMDEGLRPLHGMKQLLEVDLRQTKVTPAGVKALRAALPNCTIRADVVAEGDPYRRLAEWVIRKGGRVELGYIWSVSSRDQLPEQPFTFNLITLKSGYGQSPGDEEALLDLLAALPQSLTSVELLGRQPIPLGQTLQRLANLPGAGGASSVNVNAPLADADLRHLPRFSKLTALILSNTDVTDAGVKYVRDHLALTAFALGGARGKVTARCLADLDPRLRKLGLIGAWVTDAAVDDVRKLPNLTNVEFVDTQVTDAGVARLAERLPGLLVLKLSGSKGTDGCLAALAGHKALTSLTLGRLPITDEGLKSLHGLKQLKTLNLDQTKVTPAGVRALQAALPQCKITTSLPGEVPAQSEPQPENEWP